MPLQPRWYSGRGFQQGELDALCNVYSIINSCRVGGLLTDDDLEELIEEIFRYLDKVGLLLTVLIDGCGRSLLRELLNLTATLLAEHRGLKLVWSRPFVGMKPGQPKEKYTRVLAKHLKHARASAIAAVEYSGGVHWTVISGVKKRGLELRDSIGWGLLNLADVQFTPRRDAGVLYALRPGSIFLIRLD